MVSKGPLIISSLVISFLLILPSPVLAGALSPYHNSKIDSRSLASNDDTFLSQANSNLLDLGYGPGSLSPISQQIPVYTVNDQLWIESNYDYNIGAKLFDAQGDLLASSTIGAGTATQMYSFGSSLSTSNLTLDISNESEPYSVPLEFVNPADSPINSLVANYSISQATLHASFSSSDLSNKFDIEQCLTNGSSANQAEISLPSALGSGFLGIAGDLNTSTVEIFTENASPLFSFDFSLGLYANYTYELPGTSGLGFTNSELEVASSNSVILGTGVGSAVNLTLSYLAPLRIGRYTLRAYFENVNVSLEVATPLLIESRSASSWFWLGSCLQLAQGGPPLLSSSAELTGPVSHWPRYLYLMYQVLPGIEGFANVSLHPGLDRIDFVANSENTTLPSYIQITRISSSRVEGTDIESGGAVYVLSNGTYPAVASFAFLFGGKTFAMENASVESPYEDLNQQVALGELVVMASRNGEALGSAIVTILSDSLNASLTEVTNANGIVDVLVPPGNYTLTVKSGSITVSSSEEVLSRGISQYAAVFPTPLNYTPDVIWIISIITVIGAFGNLWFWFAKRRISKRLRPR